MGTSSRTRLSCLFLLLVQLLLQLSAAAAGAGEEAAVSGTRWAVLIAGSKGYYNYRHQADVCHAYQILKKGGLKDENIVVFMYDDIANHTDNPRPGVVINHPTGGDVYAGVPKDYTGSNVTVNNFLAALLGNRSALTGGSGKVVDSGPDDHVFVYYTDHGGAGVLGMPAESETLYANDLVDALKKKHAAGAYKSMVFYLEACESGSIFEGLLPGNISVYATTASNAVESSWATYCPGDAQPPPPGFDTCLGDLYSVAWMEDSDVQQKFGLLRNESLQQQYELVKNRTAANGTYSRGSHVMQYGDLEGIANQSIYQFMGAGDYSPNVTTFLAAQDISAGDRYFSAGAVLQRNADLVYFWQKFKKSGAGTPEKAEAQKRLLEVMSRRTRVDSSMELIGTLLFGNSNQVLAAVRPAGQPLVDDWDCLKSVVRAYEKHCGSLTQYGMKHMRSFANICNAGVGEDAMAKVASQACAGAV